MAIHIVLYQPEIPQNTGNIMRTAVATNTKLHLIEPLGFQLDEKSITRSGANYVHDTEYTIYKNWESFLEKNQGQMYFLTRYGKHGVHDIKVDDQSKDYYFILGRESSGIPTEILKKNLETCIRLPMTDKVRSLNLSNVAAIMIYEALRQQGFPGLSEYEPESMKGSNYLEKES